MRTTIKVLNKCLLNKSVLSSGSGENDKYVPWWGKSDHKVHRSGGGDSKTSVCRSGREAVTKMYTRVKIGE